MNVSLRFRPLWLSACCLAVLVGCQKSEDIRQYTVKRVAPPAPAANKPVSAHAAAAPATWFFKLSGPRELVLAQQAAFRQLLESVKFNAQGQPDYAVPADWKREDGPPPRRETLKIPGQDPPLEISVTSLPTPPVPASEYQLQNVNRWRDQLGLEPLTESNWLLEGIRRGELVELKGSEQSAAILIATLTGALEGTPEAGMLAAILTPPAPPATTARAPASNMNAPPGMEISSAASAFDHTPPASWTKSSGSSARLASFEAINDGGKLDISVTRFPGGGDLLSNVNRWREQAGLPAVTSDQLGSSVSELTLGGRAAKLVTAIGTEQGIVTALVPDGNAQWFFKMQGPVQAVNDEQPRFREWLNTVKFPTR